VVSKIADIVSSWAISINPTKEQQEIANHRLAICDKCASARYKKSIDLHYCGECGCPLSKKVFSKLPGRAACPLEKWDK